VFRAGCFIWPARGCSYLTDSSVLRPATLWMRFKAKMRDSLNRWCFGAICNTDSLQTWVPSIQIKKFYLPFRACCPHFCLALDVACQGRKAYSIDGSDAESNQLIDSLFRTDTMRRYIYQFVASLKSHFTHTVAGLKSSGENQLN
jgi:hypothetical protein